MLRIFSVRHKSLCFIISLVMLFSTSGCMNRKEVDKLGLLGAIGVDRKEDQFVLTMEVTKPYQIMGGIRPEDPFVIVQSRGDTFFDAIRNTTNTFDRKLFLATNRIFIISEETAKAGITNVLDFWWRDHDARETDYLLIAKGCNASDIIGITGGMDDIPSLYLSDLIKANSASSKSICKRTFRFLSEYYCQGKRPTLGVVQLKKKEKPVGEKEMEIRLEGSAVFREDRLVGFLDGIETRALNFVTGKIKSGIIIVPCAEKLNSIEIIKAKSKLDVIFQENRSDLKVSITVDGMLGEDQSDIDLKDPQIMKRIETACAEVITQQVTQTIQRVQKDYHLDPFGFGLVVHRKYPEKWKEIKCNWDDVFAQSELEVDVKVNLSKSGLYQLSIKSKIGQ